MNKIITSSIGNISMPDIKFTIQNKHQKFEIYYLDNQDLYFTTYTNLEKTSFQIERTDFELYRTCQNLFYHLQTNDLFIKRMQETNDEFQREYLTEINRIKSTLYNKEKKTVTLISCEPIDTETQEYCSLSIIEHQKSYEMVFHKPKKTKSCSIRVNTNRSIYKPLTALFTNFYQDLMFYNDNYQYSIEDYIDVENIKQYKKL